MDRRQAGWGMIGGAVAAFLVVRALRRNPSPKERVLREARAYLRNPLKGRVVVSRRRPRWLVPLGIFLVSRWVAANRARSRDREEQFNQVARQEGRPSIRVRARGPVETFEQPSAQPFSENLRPEEKAGQFSGNVDDLKLIEGIGPAIAELLTSYGIRRFHDLAEVDVSRLEMILSSADLGNISNPATWPEQARLAGQGRWDELHDLQMRLKAGRRTA